ncbi:unnamed protein product [Microthlaspi erraticum]|uniref:F-box associated domain-containing protein n=1 Tax=Microthlaspi erraticum TaxID=1685480 RepID=A0A6D2JGU6_9BRAS|nr:unnamed protein product [Microthlaspi erraticum]
MPVTVGFGRDIITGKYKLILIYRFDNSWRSIITKSEVLTLDNNERRCTANSFPLHFEKFSSTQTSVFAKGSLFWLIRPFDLHFHSQRPKNLVAIDLHTEKFHDVPFPSLEINYYRGAYLWSMKDRLCLSNVVLFSDVETWCLKGEIPSARWGKISSINISHVDRLNTKFWTLGLAAADMRPEGQKPPLGDLDQVPLDQWKVALYA